MLRSIYGSNATDALHVLTWIIPSGKLVSLLTNLIYWQIQESLGKKRSKDFLGDPRYIIAIAHMHPLLALPVSQPSTYPVVSLPINIYRLCHYQPARSAWGGSTHGAAGQAG